MFYIEGILFFKTMIWLFYACNQFISNLCAFNPHHALFITARILLGLIFFKQIKIVHFKTDCINIENQKAKSEFFSLFHLLFHRRQYTNWELL